MVFKEIKKILAVGAHPDDIEMGCGGFIAKAISEKIDVYTAILSKCEDEVKGDNADLRADEYIASVKTLGVSKYFIFDFPNRALPGSELQILDKLAELQADIQPDMVLIPYLEDPHQDHNAVAFAGVRTFRKNETILQYEILRHGSHTFTPTLFVDITDFLNTKLEALKCYKSQFERRPYFDLESFKSLARTRGAQSGYEYAEGFVVHKIFV
jgi:LmbE family N-acetylglucosaminyl deacetylase